MTVTSHTIHQLQREKMPGCAHTKVLTANPFLSPSVLGGPILHGPPRSLTVDLLITLTVMATDHFQNQSPISFQLCRTCPCPQTWDIRIRSNLSPDGAHVPFISCGNRARNN